MLAEKRDCNRESKLQGGAKLKDGDINKLNIVGGVGQRNISDHLWKLGHSVRHLRGLTIFSE